MIWFMIAYLLGLFYFAAHPAKIAQRRRFRRAWILFALVLPVSGLFTLLRSTTIGSARSLALLEIFSTGLSWFLLGASFWLLLGAVLPADKGTGGPEV